MNKEPAREHFSKFANALTQNFPNEDLRFNWTEGQAKVRLFIPEHSPDAHEFQLDDLNLQESVWDAIFAIKQLISAFDA